MVLYNWDKGALYIIIYIIYWCVGVLRIFHTLNIVKLFNSMYLIMQRMMKEFTSAWVILKRHDMLPLWDILFTELHLNQHMIASMMVRNL